MADLKLQIAEGITIGVEELKGELLTQLQYYGERAVNDAREKEIGEYMDRTGNLRASVGYKVLHEGDEVSGSELKGEGGKAAEAVFKEIGSVGGMELHLIAGMEYASYVEEIHNLNVLEASALKLEKELTEGLEGLVKQNNSK